VKRYFDKKKRGIAKGERVGEVIEEKFIQGVFHPRPETQGDTGCVDGSLQGGHASPHCVRRRFIGTFDEVGSAVNLPETGRGEDAGHLEGFLQVGGAVIESGEYVAVVVDHF
jgi:hypothetical protein